MARRDGNHDHHLGTPLLGRRRRAEPKLPPWERVLDEAVAAGYGGLDLGPYGSVLRGVAF